MPDMLAELQSIILDRQQPQARSSPINCSMKASAHRTKGGEEATESSLPHSARGATCKLANLSDLFYHIPSS